MGGTANGVKAIAGHRQNAFSSDKIVKQIHGG